MKIHPVGTKLFRAEGHDGHDETYSSFSQFCECD
jgi:hypothetical protein